MNDPDGIYAEPLLSQAELYPLAPLAGRRPMAPPWFERACADAPRRSRFTVDQRRIELLTWGQVGRPGLLFLHGQSACADWWSFIAPWFTKQWRCAAISFAGMGGSDWAESYTIDSFAHEAVAAIAAADLDQGSAPPLIIGHSFGGSVALRAGGLDPRLGGVVCIDTGLAPRWAMPPSRAAKAGGHRVYPDLASALSRFRLDPQQRVSELFILDHLARHALKEVEGGWTWRFDPKLWNMLDRTQVPGLAAGVRCPIAFIRGGRSRLMDAETLAFTRGIFPAATPMIALPDSDHHVMVDQPLVLVGALRTLLATWPMPAPNTDHHDRDEAAP